MDRWFTPQERGVILFLIAVLLFGVSIYIHKAKTPYFAPELKISENKEWKELSDYKGEKEIGELIKEVEKECYQIQSRDRKININLANEEELASLPSIGPVLAKQIVLFREKYGRFKKTKDILKVNGIGKKKFEKIKNKITV
jgi:comEA protein